MSLRTREARAGKSVDCGRISSCAPSSRTSSGAARKNSACWSAVSGTTPCSCSIRKAGSRRWNAGAESHQGLQGRGNHRRTFLALLPAERQSTPDSRRWSWKSPRASAGSRTKAGACARMGPAFWANVIITALFDSNGLLRGFAKVTRDMTERRRVVALEESERKMNEFLAMPGHELRNPLAPIRNALDLMRIQSSGDSTHEWARSVIDRQLTPVDAAGRRPARRRPDQQRQDRVAPRSRSRSMLRSSARSRRAARWPTLEAHAGGPPFAGAASGRRRPDSAVAGRSQSAHQRDQVHAGRRQDRSRRRARRRRSRSSASRMTGIPACRPG